MSKWGYDINAIRDMKKRVEDQVRNQQSSGKEAAGYCDELLGVNPWESIPAMHANGNGTGDVATVEGLRSANNAIAQSEAQNDANGLLKTLNEIITHHDTAVGGTFLKIKNIKNGLEDYGTLLSRYNARLTSVNAMCGHPGGGWKRIAFQEKVKLASEEGNTEAMMDLIQQMIDKGNLSEAEMSQLLFGKGMKAQSFDEWQKKNPGKGWQDYLNVFFSGKQDNYEIYLSVQKFIDKRLEEQYGKPIEQMTKEELVKWLVEMEFKEGEIQKYDEAYLRLMLKGAEQSKMIGAIMLYQQNKNSDISVYYDSALYKTTGVEITVPNNDLKPVGVCQYTAYYTDTSSGYPVSKSETKVEKGDIDETSAFCKKQSGNFSVEVTGKTTETYTISRAGNENIGLQQDNVTDDKGNPEIAPKDEIGATVVNDIVKSYENEVKRCEERIKDAKANLLSSVVDLALDFVPGGDAISAAMHTVQSLVENKGLLDGTSNGLTAFNKTVKGNFRSTEEARVAITKGVSSVKGVTEAIEQMSRATASLEQAKKDLNAANKTKEEQGKGGYIIKDSSGNIIGGSSK